LKATTKITIKGRGTPNQQITEEDIILAKEGEKCRLIKLITNNGEIVEKEGYAIPIAGIVDDNGNNAYIAGIDENGIIYACCVDTDNTVLNFDGERTRFKVGGKRHET